MNIGPDGRLWAINPEAGFFGVAPGTGEATNPNMLKTIKKGSFYPTLFTNTALDTDTNEPWWNGLTDTPPKNLLDWQGNRWDASSGKPAAHPNSRFTVSASHCPVLSKEYDNPKGVPISAVIFGGRRRKLIPLVVESFNWPHGVFLGSRMGSETTAAAAGQTGQVRRDPMAMLPFCGYNMADYFAHWLDIGRRCKNPPKIFSVNWFRTDENDKYIWPGFGDNIRVIKWMLDRIEGGVGAKETPIGLVPNTDGLDMTGLCIPQDKLAQLFDVDMSQWGQELADIKDFIDRFGARMPKEIAQEYERLKGRLTSSSRSL
jgi:phosphoenolpyruvate carboxykinase (GTP)